MRHLKSDSKSHQMRSIYIITTSKWLTNWRISSTSDYFGNQRSFCCHLFMEKSKYFKLGKSLKKPTYSLIRWHQKDDATELPKEDNRNDSCLCQTSLVLWESILFIRLHSLFVSFETRGISMELKTNWRLNLSNDAHLKDDSDGTWVIIT